MGRFVCKVRVIKKYFDNELQRKVEPKEEFEVDEDRAILLTDLKYVHLLRVSKIKDKKNVSKTRSISKGK